MLSVCPYAAISDGARAVSPVGSENGVENCTDGFGSGCEDEESTICERYTAQETPCQAESHGRAMRDM